MSLRSDPNFAVWRGNLDQLLSPKERVNPSKNHPSMPWQEIPSFMTKLRALYWPSARLLEFIILTASRSGEARGALWSEIDFDKDVWEISAKLMKMRRPHIVPLTDRLKTILKHQALFKTNDFVFPNPRTGKQFSYNAPMTSLKELECGDVTTHGFRSSFKTWALEDTNFPTQAIEFALPHETKNTVERAYIRGDKMLVKRKDIMKTWDSFCSSE